MKVKVPLRICPKCGDYDILHMWSERDKFCGRCGVEYVKKEVEVEV